MRGVRASDGELYAADEVELLLDEIRHLEPTSCPPEELQDFEIAGSGCGSVGYGADVCAEGGARSPARTDASWDSHAQYRAPPAAPPPSAVRCYCRVEPAHALPIAILVCAVVSMSLVWGALGWRLSAPLRARLQTAQFGALSSALVHAALLLARVTRIHRHMPLPWHLAVVCVCAWSCAWLCAGAAALALCARAPAYRHTPHDVATALYTAIGFSTAGSLISLFLALATFQRYRSRYRAVPPL